MKMTVRVLGTDGHGLEAVWWWNGREAWNPTHQHQKHHTHLQPLQVKYPPPVPRGKLNPPPVTTDTMHTSSP